MSERSKLLWRCRRGTREMDLLFETFLLNYFDNLTLAEKKSFESLLGEPDPDIMDWIMGRAEPANTGYKPLLEQLQSINLKGR